MYIHDRSSCRSLRSLIPVLDIPRLEATVIDLICKQAGVAHDIAVGIVVDILRESIRDKRVGLPFIDSRTHLFELIREWAFEIRIIGIVVVFQSLIFIKRIIEHTVFRGNGIEHLSFVYRDNWRRSFGGIDGKIHQRTAVVLHDGSTLPGRIALDKHVVEQSARVLNHRNIPAGNRHAVNIVVAQRHFVGDTHGSRRFLRSRNDFKTIEQYDVPESLLAVIRHSFYLRGDRRRRQ